MIARKIGEAFIRLKPDVAGFAKDASPGMASAGKSVGGSFASSFGKAFGAISVALGGLFVASKAFAFLKDATNEAREAARLMRLTEAVIKSTGGAAKITTKEVADLADRLAAVAGVDDEVIQGAENMILTFTNVRNEVGKGNDIFNQAAEAALDMTAALNNGEVSAETLRAQSLQLGKALNDPVKGMTALRRAGVTFTEAQKEQIKTMVETGDIMGAQKVILAELSKEFGGAAKAASDPAQRAQVAWANFKEEIGRFTLPIVEALSRAFTEKLLPAVERHVIPALEKLRDWLRDKVVPAIEKNVIPALTALRDWFANDFIPFVNASIIPALTSLRDWFKDEVGPAVDSLREDVEDIKRSFDDFARTLRENEDELKVYGDAIKGLAAILAVAIPIIQFLVKSFIQATLALAQQITWVFGKVGELIAWLRDRLKELGNWPLHFLGAVQGVAAWATTALFTAGQNLVTGLMNGIRSLGGWLVTALTNWVREHVPGPIRAILELGSPSRLFARMGRDTIRGFILGVNAEAGGVAGAMGQAFNLASVPGLAGGAGGTGGGTVRLDPDDLRALARILESRPVQVTIDDRVGAQADLYMRGR